MKLHTRIGLAITLTFSMTAAWAEDVLVAVAANFTKPMEKIAADFEKATGNKVVASFGSSGKLLEQIKNGAPFEVFLSADQDKPKKLEEEKLDVPGSRFTYAIGKLVLWSAKPGVVDNKGEVLKTDKFEYIAIANPETAPYGKAAMEAMTKLGVLEAVQPKIVQGESISQTKEFISSGNAELGFVALSQVIKGGKITDGSSWMVAPDLYTPINQDVILLKTGESSEAAKAFMEYLKSDEVKVLIQSFGYALPVVEEPAMAETGSADAK